MSRMTATLLIILTGAILGAGAAPTDAMARQEKVAVEKKRTSSVKKVKAVRPGKNVRQAALDDYAHLTLHSSAAMVLDQSTGATLFEKNADVVLPIASITKLMTAMVVLDTEPDLNETLSITEEDVDTLKGTHSRLRIGTQLNREDMLRLALMSSENRASSALSRHYPGGRAAFIAAMNRKARMLNLQDTNFSDPTGLTAANVSSARDLVRMVSVAQQYPLIRHFSTSTEYEVPVAGRTEVYRNTNSLVKSTSWEIGLSKTGFINEAGRCLVMQASLANRPVIIVLLDSLGKMTRLGDANRIKHWIESNLQNTQPYRRFAG